MKIFAKKIRVGYVHIEKSVDTIFTMGYGSVIKKIKKRRFLNTLSMVAQNTLHKFKGK